MVLFGPFKVGATLAVIPTWGKRKAISLQKVILNPDFNIQNDRIDVTVKGPDYLKCLILRLKYSLENHKNQAHEARNRSQISEPTQVGRVTNRAADCHPTRLL
jgi:hypothetical protein